MRRWNRLQRQAATLVEVLVAAGLTLVVVSALMRVVVGGTRQGHGVEQVVDTMGRINHLSALLRKDLGGLPSTAHLKLTGRRLELKPVEAFLSTGVVRNAAIAYDLQGPPGAVWVLRTGKKASGPYQNAWFETPPGDPAVRLVLITSNRDGQVTPYSLSVLLAPAEQYLGLDATWMEAP